MSIGYACHTIGVPNTSLKSCMLKNADEKNLIRLISYNIACLERMVDYNIKNRISLFRISSDLIPFGSSPINALPWPSMFEGEFRKIGQKINHAGMRVSMHPGQYTVLNSPDSAVVSRAIEDLTYHAKVLDSLGAGTEHKIILHIGGAYRDKKSALSRFLAHFGYLDASVRRRLVLENDDRSFHIRDVLELSSALNIPAVYDNLHNALNPSDPEKSDYDWIRACKSTWKEQDGNQKIHYSQQSLTKKRGSHSDSIRIGEFLSFYGQLEAEKPDIMLEVKDKNLSALKCILCTSTDKNRVLLETEWARYKYRILESSPNAYAEIRRLFREGDAFPAVSFYRLIENALSQDVKTGNGVNAALHVWGYFKDKATEKEKNAFMKSLSSYEKGNLTLPGLKKVLYKLLEIYQQEYLLHSYYFTS